jgi:hypothetical protein
VTLEPIRLPGLAAVAADEVRRRGLRGLKRALRPIWMRRLERRNAESRESLLSAAGPVVSLTTFEPRWPRVHYTIESIAAGHLKPSRLVLWVAPSVLALGTPEPLRRLVARGLEVRSCVDLGPHKKYFPAVMQGPAARGLVTADDDVLYPADWLDKLVAAAARRPGAIHAYRAHLMAFAPDGRFLRYADWPACRSTLPSPLHFTTGVGGVFFPPAMQDMLREAGDGFRAVCPRADDIWLNAVALRAGIPACQVSVFSPLLFEVPGTRTQGLAKHNREGGGNDLQLAATYTVEERARLRAFKLRQYGSAQ